MVEWVWNSIYDVIINFDLWFLNYNEISSWFFYYFEIWIYDILISRYIMLHYKDFRMVFYYLEISILSKFEFGIKLRLDFKFDYEFAFIFIVIVVITILHSLLLVVYLSLQLLHVNIVWMQLSPTISHIL